MIWEWNVLRSLAFNKLKQELTKYPILRQADPKRPFILYTDASGVAIGAILAQKDDDGNEYVCSYASRLFKGAQEHYGITEKECLAVVWAVRYFRFYLYGTEFQIVMDHAALKWLMNIQDPTGRFARWALSLQAYKFIIVYREAKKHTNVDTLT